MASFSIAGLVQHFEIGINWQISVEVASNSDLPIYPDLESLSVPKTSIISHANKAGFGMSFPFCFLDRSISHLNGPFSEENMSI